LRTAPPLRSAPLAQHIPGVVYFLYYFNKEYPKRQ
jgi:hypothetical protein